MNSNQKNTPITLHASTLHPSDQASRLDSEDRSSAVEQSHPDSAAATQSVSKLGSSKLGSSKFGGSTFGNQSLLTLTPRGRKLLPIALLLATIALIAIALIVGRIVQNAMQEVTRSTLRSILYANVNSLEIWMNEQKKIVQSEIDRDAVNIAAMYLINRSESDLQWQDMETERVPAHEKLLEEIQADGIVGWCILRLDNTVVSSDIPKLIGQKLPVPDYVSKSIIEMQPTICHAIASPVALSPDGPLSMPDSPIMASMAPIKSKNQCVGSLVFLFNPLGRFTELLSIARTGVSGETYAFDRQATFVSQSRFEDQLRSANVLSSDLRISSALNVGVLDPGVNLRTHGPVDGPQKQLPMTLMADLATRGGSGENVVGYNDYRGVPVVGAWTWLPEYNIGVATELNVDEAYAPMQLLRRSFWLLFGMVAVSVLTSIALLTGYRRFAFGGSTLDAPTRQLGQYHLGQMLGKGGMGSVYEGTHEFLRRKVAVKVLEGDEMTEQTATRFEREVQLTAALRHPNTIDVYDFGRTPEGTFFYVMEYVSGISLQDLVEDFGPQPAGRVIHLLTQVCGSMSEAHHHQLIHRDIKPANILISKDPGLQDHAKVLDFGLIKSMTASPTDITVTHCDTITGTPMYMSPEAVKDATSAGPLSDVYSLGAVGYALLTGQPIFEPAGSVEVCMMQVKEYPLRPSDRIGKELPEDLQNVLMSCLRKDPQERPQSMEDLAFALRSCDDAGTWDQAETLRWWEMVFRSPVEKSETLSS